MEDKKLLQDGEIDKVSGGLIIPATDDASPVRLPDTVVDERTLAVLGQAASAEEAVKLARELGVSTERITWGEFGRMKNRPEGAGE